MPSHIEVPDDAAFDWITWIARGLVIFCAGWVLKVARDVRALMTWKTEVTTLAPVRDAERRTILRRTKRMEKKLDAVLQQRAYEQGLAAGIEASDDDEYDDCDNSDPEDPDL